MMRAHRNQLGLFPIALGLLVLAASLAVCIALFGCAGAAQTEPPIVLPASTTPSATFVFCDSSRPDCAGSSAFSLRAMRDVNIAVSWRNVAAGTHTQTLRVFAPDGGLFQAMNAPFRVSRNDGGAAVVTQTLPVTGTWITARHLTGTWKFFVFLDNQPMAAGDLQIGP